MILKHTHTHTHTFRTKCFQKSESGSQSKGVVMKLGHTGGSTSGPGQKHTKNAVPTAAYLEPLALQFSKLSETETGGKNK